MGILSVQSAVAAGHVGNSAAVFALERLGFDVWRVDTVAFSNHPAHGRHTGRVVPSGDVAALLEGLEDLGLWPRCEGVISGYLGAGATGAVVANAVARIRSARPDMIYLCDPVIGDRGARYVGDGVLDFYRTQGIPAADIVTPNAFEAACLTDIAVSTVGDALAAARDLLKKGPRIAVITGIADRGAVHTLAVDGSGAWRVAAPQLAAAGFGAGDLFAALLMAHLLRRAPLPDALSRAASATHAVLALAAEGVLDLPLVVGQDALRDPPIVYPAEPVE